MGCCLTPSEQFYSNYANIMARTFVDDVCFAIDQHDYLDNSTSSMQ